MLLSYRPLFAADSLLSEIHSSLRSSNRRSHVKKRSTVSTSDFSDSEDNTDSSFKRFAGGSIDTGGGGGAFKGTFDTYKLVAGNKMLQITSSTSPLPFEAAAYNPGQGSSLDNSLADREFAFDNCTVPLDDDGSSAPTSFLGGGGAVSATLNTITDSRPRRCPSRVGAFPFGLVKDGGGGEVPVQTIGELRVPNLDNANYALSSPLGSVPSLGNAAAEHFESSDSAGVAVSQSGLAYLDQSDAGCEKRAVRLASASIGHPALGSVPFGKTSGAAGALRPVPDSSVAAASKMTASPDAGWGSLTFRQETAKEELCDRKNFDDVADGSSDAGGGDGGGVHFDVGVGTDGEFIGGDLKSSSALSSGEASEIERALQKLTAEEVERRRKMLGRTYRSADSNVIT